jgi:hypothetical protein
MKKFYLLLVLDGLLVAFSGFFVSLVLLRYFTASKFALIPSTLVGVFLAGFFAYRRIKKTDGKIKSKKEKERLEETLLTLNFMQKKEVLELVEKMLTHYKEPFEKKRDLIYLTDKKVILYLSCGIDGATKTDIVKLYNKIPDGYQGVIVCTDTSDQVKAFCDRFKNKIKLLGGEKFYFCLKECDLIPKSTVTITEIKTKQSFISLIFSRQKARTFFLLGVSFLIMSFFVAYKLYYIIFGTAFTIFSVACRFFAPTEK